MSQSKALYVKREEKHLDIHYFVLVSMKEATTTAIGERVEPVDVRKFS